MMREITIEEIIKLNSERTAGEWFAGIEPPNNRNLKFYAEVYCKEDNRPIPAHGNKDKDVAFIAAAPQITAKAIELDALARALFSCVRDNQLHDPKVKAAVELYNHVMGTLL